jgi:LysR family transcriptional regulator, hydrogen peroxide-inducible genes activator
MIVLALPFDTRGLKVSEISKENLYLVCHKADSSMAQVQSLDDLDLSRLMLLEEGHCLRDHALSACPIGERKNDHRLKASSLPTLIEMVGANLGFTLLPEIAIDTHIVKSNPDLLVKKIESAPTRTLALVTRKSTPLQSEFDVLLQILQKITTH